MWLLYAAADAARDRRTIYPFQAVPLIGSFVYVLILVLFWHEDSYGTYPRDTAAQPLYYNLCLLALLIVSLAGKYRSKRLWTSTDWLLAVPFFYMQQGGDVLYMLTLFVFSLAMLWSGSREESRLYINLGTLLFLVSVMTAYGKLAWDFMDKSLFFVIGGILLLALSWFLNRRKNKLLREIGEDTRHDHN